MQGRLSPLVEGKIQAFPSDHWEQEFPQATRLQLQKMEWTVDHKGFYANPIMTEEGRERIRTLSAASGLQVVSLTGDCFMQAPFFKAEGKQYDELLNNLHDVVKACSELRIAYLVFPLVDNGRIESDHEEDKLVAELLKLTTLLNDSDVSVLFESDYPPQRLLEFIKRLPRDRFGINYDIGNSAALGFNCAEEIDTYAEMIRNVHIKDRLYAGTTVPLGEGAANIPVALGSLERSGYRGNYILQTARAMDEQHAAVLQRYRSMVIDWLGAIQNGT